jgi:methyltransferase (TIGR00027 family)
VAESTDPAAPAVSKTSIYVAAGRAVGAREPDPAARNPDHLAEHLLGDPSSIDLDHPAVRALSLPYAEAIKDIEIVINVRLMTIRTRFIDQALERAVAGGATQVVILGAGFDSHAYRCGELLKNARVFEVDRPATQALKKQRVKAVVGKPPENLTYVPIDFAHEDLSSVLARHGCDSGRRTFFIMEGVTMYLPEEAVRRTLRFVAAHPPGSVIVFDYVYQAMVDMLNRLDLANVPAAARPFFERFRNLVRDEPWVFGLPTGSEREFLSEMGLELRETLMIGSEESVTRYLTRTDGTQVGAEAIAEATARAAEQARAAASSSASPQSPSPGPTREQRGMGYHLLEAVVR